MGELVTGLLEVARGGEGIVMREMEGGGIGHFLLLLGGHSPVVAQTGVTEGGKCLQEGKVSIR